MTIFHFQSNFHQKCKFDHEMVLLPQISSKLCRKDICQVYLPKWSNLVIFSLFQANFGQHREISREKAHFPPGNFPVTISRFPFSRREMCNSNFQFSSSDRNISFLTNITMILQFNSIPGVQVGNFHNRIIKNNKKILIVQFLPRLLL